MNILSNAPNLDLGKELSEIENRMLNRINTIETRRQRNIDFITISSMKELSDKDIHSDKPIDEDWINRFFLNARDISDEHMQYVWGKILAGEIINPGSFSLRSIETIKNMNYIEAKVFQGLVQYAINVGECGYIIRSRKFLKSFPQGDYRIWMMKGINLIHEGILTTTFHFDNTQTLTFSYGSCSCDVSGEIGKDTLTLDTHSLTQVGSELAKLIDVTPDVEHFENVCKEIESHGFMVKSKYK